MGREKNSWAEQSKTADQGGVTVFLLTRQQAGSREIAPPLAQLAGLVAAVGGVTRLSHLGSQEWNSPLVASLIHHLLLPTIVVLHL